MAEEVLYTPSDNEIQEIVDEVNKLMNEDLNSTNGTMVNGEALSYKERRKLEINDIVQLADVQYKFV